MLVIESKLKLRGADLSVQFLNVIFYSSEPEHNRTKVEVLDTTWERQTNMAQEYSSMLRTKFQRNKTIRLLPFHSSCICEIVLVEV